MNHLFRNWRDRSYSPFNNFSNNFHPVQRYNKRINKRGMEEGKRKEREGRGEGELSRALNGEIFREKRHDGRGIENEEADCSIVSHCYFYNSRVSTILLLLSCGALVWRRVRCCFYWPHLGNGIAEDRGRSEKKAAATLKEGRIGGNRGVVSSPLPPPSILSTTA